MNTTLTQLSPQVILAPIAGRFDAHQVPKIQKEIDAALADGATTIIMELSEVNFVDSSALAVMVRTMKHCRERGGELILCGLRQPVRIIFELTRMDKAFRIFDDVVAARAAVGV
jgi:anti-sigma B factor antagonist